MPRHSQRSPATHPAGHKLPKSPQAFTRLRRHRETARELNAIFGAGMGTTEDEEEVDLEDRLTQITRPPVNDSR